MAIANFAQFIMDLYLKMHDNNNRYIGILQSRRTGRRRGDMEELKTLVSGILTKEGRKFARISFMRGQEYAEFIVPDGCLDSHRGFSEEEISKLQEYVKEESDSIMEKARGVNVMKNWLGI